MKVNIIFKGGAGSGHHGHRGVPGQRGGSAPGGGSGGGADSKSSPGFDGLVAVAERQRGSSISQATADRLRNRYQPIADIVGSYSTLEDMVSGDWEYWESSLKFELTPAQRKRVTRYIDSLWGD